MARSFEVGFDVSCETKRRYFGEDESTCYDDEPEEEMPRDSIPRERDGDSCRFSIHTAVQIPEITSFRLTEVDVQARLTSSIPIFQIVALHHDHMSTSTAIPPKLTTV